MGAVRKRESRACQLENGNDIRAMTSSLAIRYQLRKWVVQICNWMN